LFFFFFFFNDTATTEIYTVSDTLSLHDALPISACWWRWFSDGNSGGWNRPRSEEHTYELQSPDTISYAVFCLKKKKKKKNKKDITKDIIKKQTKKKNKKK